MKKTPSQIKTGLQRFVRTHSRKYLFGQLVLAFIVTQVFKNMSSVNNIPVVGIGLTIIFVAWLLIALVMFAVKLLEGWPPGYD